MMGYVCGWIDGCCVYIMNWSVILCGIYLLQAFLGTSVNEIFISSVGGPVLWMNESC
jgi:hypothetical protein